MTGNLYVTDAETSAYKTSHYKTSMPSNASDASTVFHQLITALQQVLPNANLAKTYVPLLSKPNQPFYLWLIDPDFCHEDLTPTVELLDNLFELKQQLGMDKVDVLLVADVLYDKANLPLLDVFLQYAHEVWVADSRVKNFAHPRYHKVTTLDNTTTLPDMDEAKQFNQVVLYRSTD